MWKELISNVFWVNDNFLNDEYIDNVLKYIRNYSTVDIEQSNTHYEAYADSIRYKPEYSTPVLNVLNEQYDKIFGKKTQLTGMSSLQFATKRFIPNKSYYALHTEKPLLYGDCVFMFYLTDETDGDLVLPDFDFRITPKRNRCVIMRTGHPHLVEKCSGYRYCITGWSFAPHNRMTKNVRKNYDKI